jgi:hypothetical protein
MLSVWENYCPDQVTFLRAEPSHPTTVVEHYSVDKEGDKSYKSDTEEVEKVSTTEALRCLEIVKL